MDVSADPVCGGSHIVDGHGSGHDTPTPVLLLADAVAKK
jgi:hypothetical protein